MIVIKTPEHNDLGDDVSEVFSVDSFPGYQIKLEEKYARFEEFKVELMRLRLDENNKGDQWEEQEEMNIYTSARDPEKEKFYEDREM